MRKLDKDIAGKAKLLAREQIMQARFAFVNAIAPVLQLGDAVPA